MLRRYRRAEPPSVTTVTACQTTGMRCGDEDQARRLHRVPVTYLVPSQRQTLPSECRSVVVTTDADFSTGSLINQPSSRHRHHRQGSCQRPSFLLLCLLHQTAVPPRNSCRGRTSHPTRRYYSVSVFQHYWPVRASTQARDIPPLDLRQDDQNQSRTAAVVAAAVAVAVDAEHIVARLNVYCIYRQLRRRRQTRRPCQAGSTRSASRGSMSTWGCRAVWLLARSCCRRRKMMALAEEVGRRRIPLLLRKWRRRRRRCNENTRRCPAAIRSSLSLTTMMTVPHLAGQCSLQRMTMNRPPARRC